MSLTQFLIMAVTAVGVTVPVVLLIPRVRTSPVFDRLLWVATPIVGFLTAWVAVAMARDAHVWDTLLIADTPVVPTIGGALGAALAVNVPLWLLDRFEPEEENEADVIDEETTEPVIEDESEKS